MSPPSQYNYVFRESNLSLAFDNIVVKNSKGLLVYNLRLDLI